MSEYGFTRTCCDADNCGQSVLQSHEAGVSDPPRGWISIRFRQTDHAGQTTETVTHACTEEHGIQVLHAALQAAKG